MDCLKSLLLLVLILTGATPCFAKDDKRFASVTSYLEESVANETVAGGSVLVFHKGDIVFQSGFGYADIKSQRPFQIDTPVVVASVSKPLLGTALYRLVDTGRLDVSTPVSKYLAEFSACKLESGLPVKRAPTVTELLTHTAGLRYDDAPEGRIWFQDWTKNQTLEFVVGKVAIDFPFKTQPGTRFAYSGIGTEIAARVGEVITDLPRNEMLEALLCQPLGMKYTFYRDERGLQKLSGPMPTRYFRSKKSGKLLVSTRRDVPAVNRYSSSGGNIISTAPDLLRWLLMIRNGGVHEGTTFLSPDTVSNMLKPHGPGKTAHGGLFVRETNLAGEPVHWGHTGSSGTSVWFDRAKDTIGIMLTQTKFSDIRPFRTELQKRITSAVIK
ncbi:MAG: serine hydrolase [Verrucomicrobiales bacterium]|nr:serine hydrolase [Verrucomicrobiales bacterium]